jgi:hypothetical protein
MITEDSLPCWRCQIGCAALMRRPDASAAAGGLQMPIDARLASRCVSSRTSRPPLAATLSAAA